MKFTACLLLVVLALPGGWLAPCQAHAEERSAAAAFGLGFSAFVVTIPYGVAKTAYAILGTIAGGLAWTLTTGDRNAVARSIIQPALRGDYVVTPEQLAFERPLSFSGRDPTTDPNPYR